MGTCTAETAESSTDWTTLIEHVSSGTVDAMLVASNNGRVVLVSETYLDQLRRLAGSHAARSSAPVLSARETEVLALAADGHTGVSIANELGLAVNTVAQHLVSARRKLGVRTTKDAIARAAELTGNSETG